MSLDQFPVLNEGNTTVMDYYLGYRWFDERELEPLYAFGYGLSYSTFKYERLHVPCAEVSSNGLIQVEVDVRNVAGPAGDEVVQVYASYPDTRARRSIKELKGFARIHLEPGEGKRVSVPLRIRDLKYWDMSANDWVIEKGPVLLQVGPSSDNLLLSQTVTVN
jgi:beta-glucosidase